METQEFPFPVYGTQGGGLARRVNNDYVFVTDPGCPGLQVGDLVPQEWSLAPANDAALTEVERFEAPLEF